MSSRHSAARPKRAGETFARTHHNDHDDNAETDQVKFDIRNPSNLAPDAPEDDALLEADVISGGRGTKRGAVNIDGYDSDSENEHFNAKAVARKKGQVNILEELDNYNAKGKNAASTKDSGNSKDDDEDVDLFAQDEDDDMFAETNNGKPEDQEDEHFEKSGKKKKAVKFLDSAQIQGEEEKSRSGGKIRLDEQESSDDEEDRDLAIQEEGIDEEVGAGGLKRNAPKVEAFNLREEMEEGRFDQDGTYVRKANDPDAMHDNWLDGVGKKDIKSAAAAQEKREAEARQKRIEEDQILVSDLLAALITRLEKAETTLEALARLEKMKVKSKKIPQWKLKKMNKGNESMEVDEKKSEDPKQTALKEDITAITGAADKLLSRGYDDIYEQERELLVREYRRETGEDWVDAQPHQSDDEQEAAPAATRMWEFRWIDGRDGAAKQGPFDGPTMEAWKDAGYFKQGVEFRAVGAGEEEWSESVNFT